MKPYWIALPPFQMQNAMHECRVPRRSGDARGNVYGPHRVTLAGTLAHALQYFLDMNTNQEDVMTFPRTKFGFAVNPVGEYVRLDYRGSIMLGEVKSIYRAEVTGNTHAVIRHFNGEQWPIEPMVTALTWIKQNA